MCTSAGSGGGDVRENAPATPPIAPPACLLASFSCWGLWWGLEAGVGVGGVQKVARGGALLGLCWCWCRPSCRHSAASLAPVAPRTCPCAACSCCVVWCGSVAAGNGPATFVGAVLGLCMGSARGLRMGHAAG